MVVVLLSAAWFSRDLVLKSYILRQARSVLQTDVTLDRVQTSVFPLSLRIAGLAVGNPKGYPSGNAFRVEEFYIRLVPGAFKGPTNEIDEIRLNVSSIAVISKVNGRNNFSDLFDPVSTAGVAEPTIPDSSGARDSAKTEEAAEVHPAPDDSGGRNAQASGVNQQVEDVVKEYAGDKPIHIGLLTLRLGVVNIQTEKGEGKKPKVQLIEVKGEHTLHNVTDLEAAQRELGSAMLIHAMPSLLHDALKDK